MKYGDKILSELLVKHKLLSAEDAQKYSLETQKSQESLSQLLITRGVVSEERILNVLADNLRLGKVSLRGVVIDKAVIQKVPVKFVSYYKFVPLRIDGKTLTLAAAVPVDIKVQDEIRVHLGFEPKIVLAKESEINEALKKCYGLGAETINEILTQEPLEKAAHPEESDKWVEDIEAQSADASVSKLVNQIILDAYQKRATDIHIEPYRQKVRVRYRIDGILVDAHLASDVKHFLLPILSRIKIMANLSIVEKRIPQDGSAVVKTKDQDLDLRVSTIPTPRGESMVIRILPTKVILFSLEKLGLTHKNLRLFRELVKKPHGIIFVTGPTGSGKTTTLYACLNEINAPERKIITIEDPVEYEMEGITQIQVNPKVNLNFSNGLRNILRHDPDIIMVGEVRDAETAEIAIRTALTGHLVFSTLHTNDAASGITRLIEMGVEPYLVGSSVEAFVAQRLVRLICPQCKVVFQSELLEIKEEMMEALRLTKSENVKIYRGKGCDQCNHTGYYGRTAIYEILVMSDTIRNAVLEHRHTDEIKQLAIKEGMTTLRQNGWRCVLDGITTPEEVLNVTAKEEYPHLVGDVIVEPAKAKAKTEKTTTVQNRFRTISKDILKAKNEYEARVYPRVNAKVKITYRILRPQQDQSESFKEETVEYSAVTEDISAGGLRFANSMSIPVGTILDVTIHIEEEKRAMRCLAKVCRITEDHFAKIFKISVCYLDLSSGDRAKLNTAVKERLKKSSQ